ncbi:MAG: hypothetical protein CMJ89_05775 [Planctomycetes bacterium]|nr:hypothetical protein [Planctomycetota bacterium]
MFYVVPSQPFRSFGFGPGLQFASRKNIMTNLIRFCGFKKLHQNCWLYRYLQEKIRSVKFAGSAVFAQWCTYPAWYKFHEKMRPDVMTLTRAQMDKWEHFLRTNGGEIREQCQGPVWESYYEPE